MKKKEKHGKKLKKKTKMKKNEKIDKRKKRARPMGCTPRDGPKNCFLHKSFDRKS